MSKKEIAAGAVHKMPPDLKKSFANDGTALAVWEGITRLARNEFICWMEDAKKQETRSKRIGRMISDLKKGKRRPCCWPGCPHLRL